MQLSKGRLTWEVIIAGAIMGIVGAVSQFFGWQTAAEILPTTPPTEAVDVTQQSSKPDK